jgi:lysophospholipase L1-like esterase
MRALLRSIGIVGMAVFAIGAAPPGKPRYVAMGSSYAAGISIGPQVPESPKRCGRTVNNYPHLLAQHAQLNLVDVTCSGATTEHILTNWNELPAQIDAVGADTRLVTVTIGGNDVNYVRDLMRAVCAGSGAEAISASCPPAIATTEASWAVLEANMRLIAREVRKRAPTSRLVFVEYLRVIPEDRTCASLPLDAPQLAQGRATIRRLAALTARVAKQEGAYLLPASTLSKGHETCSRKPWAQGYPATEVGWHPTAAGHAAVASALAKLIKGWRL